MTHLQALQLLFLPWIASEYLVFRRDFQVGEGEQRDVGSRLAIFAGIGMGITLALRSAHARLLALPGSAWVWLATGVALMGAGVLIRRQAVRQLGEYFRTRVILLNEHQLVTYGLYARLRHPAYSGALLTCAGVGLATASLAGFAAMIACPGLAIFYRIRIEERALADRFGRDWQEHCARTAVLIPGLW